MFPEKFFASLCFVNNKAQICQQVNIFLMKCRHIVSKGQKLKVRKFQALSLSEKKVIKKNPTGGVNLPASMHNRVMDISMTLEYLFQQFISKKLHPYSGKSRVPQIINCVHFNQLYSIILIKQSLQISPWLGSTNNHFFTHSYVI